MSCYIICKECFFLSFTLPILTIFDLRLHSYCLFYLCLCIANQHSLCPIGLLLWSLIESHLGIFSSHAISCKSPRILSYYIAYNKYLSRMFLFFSHLYYTYLQCPFYAPFYIVAFILV